MGKGDLRTTKGKRYNSSYGKSRPKSKNIVSPAATSAKAPVARKAAATKKKA